MRIQNISEQNIQGFTDGKDKCDFPAGDINVVPESLGKAALKEYDFLKEAKETKIKAVEVKEEIVQKKVKKAKK